MPNALANIGSMFSSPTAKGLMTGAGAASNIAGAIQNWQQQRKYNNAQSYLQNLITNPTAFATAAQKYTQPLSQGLISAVTNATNANLAEKGLGGSSAITQATLAEALAPYIQQNQMAGQQALLSSMGMTRELMPNGTNQFTDISKLLQQLRAGQTAAPADPTVPIDPGLGPNAIDPLLLNAPGAGNISGMNTSTPDWSAFNALFAPAGG